MGDGFPPNFERPLAAKLCVVPGNVLEVQERVLEVLYHHAKFGGARISLAAGVAKNVEFFVCQSVCLPVWLSVRHAFERQRLCAQFRHEGVGVQKRF